MKHVVVSQQAIANTAGRRPELGRRPESEFYISAAVLMILLALVGFGPSMIDPSGRNAPSTPLVLAHGIAVGAWLLLFLAQTILVATRRTAAHRRMGTIAPVLALLMVILGLVVLIRFARRGYDFSGDVIRAVSRTGSARFDPAALLFPLSELLNFGVLVGAAFGIGIAPTSTRGLCCSP